MKLIIFCNDGFIDIHIKITGFTLVGYPCPATRPRFCSPYIKKTRRSSSLFSVFIFNLPNRIGSASLCTTYRIKFQDAQKQFRFFQIQANISCPFNWPHRPFSRPRRRHHRQHCPTMPSQCRQQWDRNHHRHRRLVQMMRYLKLFVDLVSVGKVRQYIRYNQ